MRDPSGINPLTSTSPTGQVEEEPLFGIGPENPPPIAATAAGATSTPTPLILTTPATRSAKRDEYVYYR